jgi:hypothetical protein
VEVYRNLGGNSGITAYKIEDDSIEVEFRGQSVYLYNYQKPGQKDVENMKKLAVSGQGLNSYISKYVRDRYARRLR